MRERGSRSAAIGIAIAMLFGASGGMLASRWTAQASEAPRIAPPAPRIETPAPRIQTPASLGVTPLEPRDPAPSRRSCGARGARLVRFRVQVQHGFGVSRNTFARQVRAILCDARGWTASGRVRFRYDPQGPTIVSLRSASATERRCLALTGLSVGRTYSCAGAREAVLNADRWFEGSPTLHLSVRAYRRLLVNHEVGHLLGHHHLGCSRAGGRAPVMMQQSKGLGGCRPNVWPIPYELATTR